MRRSRQLATVVVSVGFALYSSGLSATRTLSSRGGERENEKGGGSGQGSQGIRPAVLVSACNAVIVHDRFRPAAESSSGVVQKQLALETVRGRARRARRGWLAERLSPTLWCA